MNVLLKTGLKAISVFFTLCVVLVILLPSAHRYFVRKAITRAVETEQGAIRWVHQLHINEMHPPKYALEVLWEVATQPPHDSVTARYAMEVLFRLANGTLVYGSRRFSEAVWEQEFDKLLKNLSETEERRSEYERQLVTALLDARSSRGEDPQPKPTRE